MKRGTVYCGLDGLDVLEAMGDNQISLIYLDIPDQVGIRSKRINYDESGKNPVSTLIKEVFECRCQQ